MKLSDLFCRAVGRAAQYIEPAELIPVPAPIAYDAVDTPEYQASVIGLMDAMRPWFDCNPANLSKLRLAVALKKGLNGNTFYVNVPIQIVVRDTICRTPSIVLVASKFEIQEDLYALGSTVVKLDGKALGLKLRLFSGGIQHFGLGDHMSVTHTLTVNGE